MMLRNRVATSFDTALASLFVLTLTVFSGCDSSGDRSCDTADDCFVGEVCIDNLCVTDPSGDTGSKDTGQNNDTSDPQDVDRDTTEDTGANDTATQDTGTDDTSNDTRVDDTGDNDGGIDTDPIQTCNPSTNSLGTPPWLLPVSTVQTDKGYDVAVDASGNAYVVGQYVGTLEIAGCTLYSAIGSLDRSTSSALVVKISPQGEVLWAKGFTDPEGATATNVAVTSSGGVVITGYFDGIMDFGGGSLENEDYNTNDINRPDVFVAGFNADGSHDWSTVFNGDQIDYPTGIAVDGSDNVYLTGYFKETLTIGSSQLTSQTLGKEDIFLTKLDGSGSVEWATRFGGDQRDLANGIDVDDDGNIFIIGEFEGTASFGTGDVSSNDDSDDIFIARYSTNGNPDWLEVFGSSRDDMGEGIVYDDANDVIYVTGAYRSAPIIGNQSMPYAQILNIFLAKYDADGTFQWAEGYGGDRADQAFDVTTDSTGSVYLTGSILSDTDFGSDQGNDPPGGGTVFVVSFDSSANLRWARVYGNFGEDTGRGLAVADNGQTYLTGSYNQDFTFHATDYTSAGREDMFILSVNP
jgi:hypothetical protein